MADNETAPSAEDFSRLNAALAAERNANAQLLAERDTVVNRLNESESGRAAAEESAISGNIAGLKAQIETLETEESDLMSEGKFREAAAVRTKIGTAVSRLTHNEHLLERVNTQRSAAPTRSADPVEAFISNAAGGPRPFNQAEVNWIRRNSRYATDPAFRERVNLAHSEAVGRLGLSPSDPQYFQHLEDSGYQRQAAASPAGVRQNAAGGGARAATEDTGGDIDDTGSPYSDTGAEHVQGTIVDGVEIIIGQEPVVEQQRAAAPPPVQERADKPQPRAAGTAPGSSIAAAPTRRSLSGQRAVAQQQRVYISPEEMETAFNLAQTIAPDIAAKGMPHVGAWWSEWKNSKSANEKRQRWANGG